MSRTFPSPRALVLTLCTGVLLLAGCATAPPVHHQATEASAPESPHPHAEWVKGHYAYVDGKYHWVPGHWKVAGEEARSAR